MYDEGISVKNRHSEKQMTVGVLVELVLRKCTLCRIYHVGTVVVDLPQFF